MIRLDSDTEFLIKNESHLEVWHTFHGTLHNKQHASNVMYTW